MIFDEKIIKNPGQKGSRRAPYIPLLEGLPKGGFPNVGPGGRSPPGSSIPDPGAPQHPGGVDY